MTLSRSHHYRFEEIEDGVHAGIARREGDAICNSGLVDLGDSTLVFDTGLSPRSADELVSEVARQFGHPKSLVANSHWHLDHTLGNPRFPGVPIFGTRRTREILLEKHDALMAELTREGIEKDLRALEARQQTNLSEGARTDVELYLRINRSLLADLGQLRLVPPDHPFETRLELPGSRPAELLSFGSGHTEA
ncbi:MAG: MBL fold metallo-hydrolase, partial [Thermoplasmata archaeon]|nr:MBL fold metallo-hydrolase [Thermoplasmata archaeon]